MSVNNELKQLRRNTNHLVDNPYLKHKDAVNLSNKIILFSKTHLNDYPILANDALNLHARLLRGIDGMDVDKNLIKQHNEIAADLRKQVYVELAFRKVMLNVKKKLTESSRELPLEDRNKSEEIILQVGRIEAEPPERRPEEVKKLLLMTEELPMNNNTNAQLIDLIRPLLTPVINAVEEQSKAVEDLSKEVRENRAALSKHDKKMYTAVVDLQQSLEKHSEETIHSLNLLRNIFADGFVSLLNKLSSIDTKLDIQASVINGLAAAIEKMPEKTAQATVEMLTPHIEKVTAKLSSLTTSTETNTVIVEGLVKTVLSQPAEIVNATVEAFSKNKMIVWSKNDFEDAKARCQWNPLPNLNFIDGKSRNEVLETVRNLCGHPENTRQGKFHYVGGDGTEGDPLQYLVGIFDSNKSIIGFPLEVEVCANKILVSFDFEKDSMEDPNYKIIQIQFVDELLRRGLISDD